MSRALFQTTLIVMLGTSVSWAQTETPKSSPSESEGVSLETERVLGSETAAISFIRHGL